jgi:hypothetical protein
MTEFRRIEWWNPRAVPCSVRYGDVEE